MDFLSLSSLKALGGMHINMFVFSFRKYFVLFIKDIFLMELSNNADCTRE